MFIYKVTNKINGKIYIGQTARSVKKRWLEHIRYKGTNCLLSKAIKKYGKESFTIKVIEVCNSINKLNKKEQYWIKFYNSQIPNGYNLTTGGKNCQHSDISRKKISVSHFGKNNGMFGKCGRLNPMFGIRGKNHHWFNKKHSKKSKLKMSEVAKKRKIKCLELNKIYYSIKSAAEELSLQKSNICKVLTSERSHTGGYSFKYLEEING